METEQEINGLRERVESMAERLEALITLVAKLHRSQITHERFVALFEEELTKRRITPRS